MARNTLIAMLTRTVSPLASKHVYFFCLETRKMNSYYPVTHRFRHSQPQPRVKVPCSVYLTVQGLVPVPVYLESQQFRQYPLATPANSDRTQKERRNTNCIICSCIKSKVKIPQSGFGFMSILYLMKLHLKSGFGLFFFIHNKQTSKQSLLLIQKNWHFFQT